MCLVSTNLTGVTGVSMIYVADGKKSFLNMYMVFLPGRVFIKVPMK